MILAEMGLEGWMELGWGDWRDWDGVWMDFEFFCEAGIRNFEFLGRSSFGFCLG